MQVYLHDKAEVVCMQVHLHHEIVGTGDTGLHPVGGSANGD